MLTALCYQRQRARHSRIHSGGWTHALLHTLQGKIAKQLIKSLTVQD